MAKQRGKDEKCPVTQTTMKRWEMSCNPNRKDERKKKKREKKWKRILSLKMPQWSQVRVLWPKTKQLSISPHTISAKGSLLLCYWLHSLLGNLLTRKSSSIVLWCYTLHSLLVNLLTRKSSSIVLWCYTLHSLLVNLLTRKSSSIVLCCVKHFIPF